MISTVKPYGSLIEIYDENGNYKASINARDGLVGYTSTTVTVKSGSLNEIYDENGNYLRSV